MLFLSLYSHYVHVHSLCNLIAVANTQWKSVFLNTNFANGSLCHWLQFTIMVNFDLQYSVLRNTMN